MANATAPAMAKALALAAASATAIAVTRPRQVLTFFEFTLSRDCKKRGVGLAVHSMEANLLKDILATTRSHL